VATYQERLGYRRSHGGKTYPSLFDGAMASSTPTPAPLLDGYYRSYQPQVRGLIDRTPLPCERSMAWFLAKIKRINQA
jgi:hypothetical protein